LQRDGKIVLIQFFGKETKYLLNTACSLGGGNHYEPFQEQKKQQDPVLATAVNDLGDPGAISLEVEDAKPLEEFPKERRMTESRNGYGYPYSLYKDCGDGEDFEEVKLLHGERHRREYKNTPCLNSDGYSRYFLYKNTTVLKESPEDCNGDESFFEFEVGEGNRGENVRYKIESLSTGQIYFECKNVADRKNVKMCLPTNDCYRLTVGRVITRSMFANFTLQWQGKTLVGIENKPEYKTFKSLDFGNNCQHSRCSSNQSEFEFFLYQYIDDNRTITWNLVDDESDKNYGHNQLS